jgi:hypothetical protein
VRATVYADEKEFERRFAADAVQQVKKFGTLLTGDVAARFEQLLTANTPVARKPNRSKNYGHAPGLMRRSWRQKAVVSAGGRAYGLWNAAAHATVINRGRKPNKAGYWVRTDSTFDRRFEKNRKRKNQGRYWMPKGSRMLGSKLAPAGVVWPTWKMLKHEEEALTAAALLRAEAA